MTTQSQFLCIVGPHQAMGESMTTLIAAKYAASAAKANIPVVSFVCKLSRSKDLNDRTPEAEGLISLVYGLIRQLINLLPLVFESKKQLDLETFERLDGTLKTWPLAIAVLKALLDSSPSVLLCVIDGFELLEDPSTQKYLVNLIDALCGHNGNSDDRKSTKRTLKILFTTAGRSRCLLDHLADNELVFAEQSKAGRKPGKPGPGRRSLSPLKALGGLQADEADL